MTIGRTTLLLLSAAISLAATASPASAFLAATATATATAASTAAPSSSAPRHLRMAAESEVSFSDDLDGSSLRIGVLRTRWNDEHVSNLVEGIKVSGYQI